MHRMDWRVAAAVACVLVILGGLAAVALSDDDDPQVVQTAQEPDAPQPSDETGADDGQAPEAAPTTEPAADPTATAATAEGPTPSEAPVEEPTPTVAPEASGTPAPTDQPAADVHPIAGEGCVVFLHGAGWSGDPYTEDWGDKTFIWPYSGNDEFPHFWLYDGPFLTYGDDDTAYDAAVANVRAHLDDNNCGPVMITGASNGGAFLAKMYCRGEDFGGRLWGVHVDDPVPDAGVLNCNPSPTVIRTMFTHSTQLVEEAAALPGGVCSATDSMYGSWYCEDDRALTLAEYEAAIGETSILSRAEHSGRASPETDFWQFVTPWFHEYDPDRFSAIPN